MVAIGIVCIDKCVPGMTSDIDPATSGEVNDPSLVRNDASSVTQFNLEACKVSRCSESLLESSYFVNLQPFG